LFQFRAFPDQRAVKIPDSGRRKLYYLTKTGKELIHVLIQISQCSDRHLSDIVEIPPERREVLRNNPDAMIEETLKGLEAWEHQYGLL